jgi:hypothetical protein
VSVPSTTISCHSTIGREGVPCQPLEYVDKNAVGLFSGFREVTSFEDESKIYSVAVNDTKPIWFYCSAQGSCNKYKMIGFVNPVSESAATFAIC